MRLKLSLSVLALGMLIMQTGRTVAAEATELIPQSVAAIVRMQAPKTTLKEAAAFVDSVQPGFGALISGQAGMLGVGISNPTMQGVDQSRDWYVATFLNGEEDPGVVFVIPAIDVDAMKSAIDDDFTFISKDDYGIYSESEDAMELMQAHIDSPRGQSIADVATTKMKDFFGQAHFSMAVNLVVIKETYSNELWDVKDQITEGMKDLQGEMPEVPGMKLDWVPGLVEKLVENGQVAVEDVQAYAFKLNLAETGIELSDYMEFAEGSRVSSFLQEHPPELLTALDKLPANQLAYGSFGKHLSKYSELSMELVPKMFELTDEQKAGWSEASKMISEIDYGTTAASFGFGDMESGLLRLAAVNNVAPVRSFRQITEKVVAVMDGMEFPGMKQEMELTKGYETVDGVTVDLLVTEQVLDEDADFGGFQEQMNQILYGSEGVEARIAYLDGAYVRTVGGGTEFMKDVLGAYKASSSSEDEVLTRDMKPLGSQNNIVAYLDLQTLLVQGLKLAVEAPNLPPLPIDAESVEDLEVERSYIGLGIKTFDNGASGMLHIPKETISAGIQLFGFFQQVQQQNNAF